jgi:peptide/nickel transport system substrate-binding protein
MGRNKTLALLVCVVLIGSTLWTILPIGLVHGQSSSNSTLVVGMTSAPDVTDLNPMRNIITYYVAETWLSLVGWDSNGTLVPQLARSWTISTNGSVYTFYLRDDLKWSDGQPLTAQDVNFSAYAIAQQSSFWNSFYFGPIMVADSSTPTGETIKPGAITLPNSTTIVFHLPGPSATFLTEGASYWIIPEHVYQNFNFTAQNPDLSTEVGSGPFIPRSYTPGTELDMVANPYYYGGAPKFSALDFKYFQSSTAAELALESGGINVLESVPPTDAQAIGKVPGISISTQEDQSNIYLVFNMEPTVSSGATNPVSNELVRKAIAMALDINSILNSSLGEGHYLLANQIEVPNMRYEGQQVQNTTIPKPEYPYDPATAAQLLNQAGFPEGSDGTRFTLSLVAPSGGIGDAGTGPTVKMLQLIQSQLSQVGIEVQITLDDTTTYNNVVFGAAPPKSWNLALSIISESPDADVAPYFMVGSLNGNAGAGGFDAGTYNNTLVNQLILREENTTAPALRIPIIQRIDGIIHNDLPVLELYYQVEVVAYSSNIQGFQFGLGEPAYDYWGNLKPSSLDAVYLATTPVSSTSTSTSSASGLGDYVWVLVGTIIVVIFAVVVYVMSRRGKQPSVTIPSAPTT